MEGRGNVKVEERAEKVLVYDLPSENYKHLINKEVKDRVRSVRVNCTYKLHGLGLQCTESVILVVPSKANEVDKVISEVFSEYEKLNKELQKAGVGILPKPIVRVLSLTQEQRETFKELAERRLKEKLDELIERIAELISELDEIVEEEAKKKLKTNINKQRREVERLEKFAKELGIDLGSKVDLLSELYSKALEKLEGVA